MLLRQSSACPWRCFILRLPIAINHPCTPVTRLADRTAPTRRQTRRVWP